MMTRAIDEAVIDGSLLALSQRCRPRMRMRNTAARRQLSTNTSSDDPPFRTCLGLASAHVALSIYIVTSA